MEKINKLLEIEIYRFKEHYLTVSELLTVCVIFLITTVIVWLLGRIIFRKTKLDKGSSYALYQLFKYVIWIMAIVLMLEAAGVEYTVVLAGSAALLVGIGLGLQSTFTDILSGVILLFEKSVKIDDILEIDGDIIKLQSIGLRTSKGVNRRQINVILPNSLITTNKVINWSHQTYNTGFSINVGVAYGSDIDLVTKLLEESAIEHPEVLEDDSLDVRLIEFGASSLDFQLLFYSQNIFSIEKVRSDIRKIIVRKFHEHNITIPFPQLDMNLNSKEGLIEK
jgi:small-conductance mechanosensitive channel